MAGRPRSRRRGNAWQLPLPLHLSPEDGRVADSQVSALRRGVAESRRLHAAGDDTLLHEETLAGRAGTIDGFWDILALHRVLVFAGELGKGRTP